MVPGSTFRYGSHFCRVTLNPRLSRRQPMEEAATPLPREETTPPVTNIYFGAIRRARAGFYLRDGLLNLRRSDVHTIMGSEERTVKCKVPLAKNRKSNPRRNLFVEMVFINPGEVPARDFRLMALTARARPCGMSETGSRRGPSQAFRREFQVANFGRESPHAADSRPSRERPGASREQRGSQQICE